MDGLKLERAVEILTAQVSRIAATETVPLLEATGRILARDYFAQFDNPPFNRSPLDGYALNSAETPNNFKVVGEECSGDFFTGEIKTGECLRIMTGAAIPSGCDCVIRQEDVTVDGENIFVPYRLKRHENFCFAGEDVKRGQILVEKNIQLSSKHIAILASHGYATVEIFRQPKIAIASTGDELINPSEKLTAGKIYNSNLFFIAARLKEFGFSAINLGNLPDDAATASEKIHAAGGFDLLITTGGVSVGKKDIMHAVVENLGEKIFWRVLMKPGAPVIGWKAQNFLGVALSGNPFAAFATFELLCRPVIAKISGRADILYSRRFIRAKILGDKIYLQTQNASGAEVEVVLL